MANLHFNDYTFVLSASTKDEVFDDLVSKFPNINFERQDLELNYNQRVDAFFLSNGIKKYEVGNLKFETINEKTSIKTTETTNNAPFALITVTRENMFSVNSPKLKEEVIAILDYLEEQHNIKMDVSFMQHRVGGGYLDVFFDSQSLKKITLNSNIGHQEAKRTGQSVFWGKQLDQEKFNTLIEVLNIQKELLLKTQLLKNIIHLVGLQAIEEQYEFYKEHETTIKATHTINNIETRISRGETAKSIYADIHREIFSTSNISSDTRRISLFETLVNKNKDFIDFPGSLKDFVTFYIENPASSPTLERYIDFIKDFSIEKVNKEIRSKSDLGNFFANVLNLSSQNNQIIVPQGLKLSETELETSLSTTPGITQNISILSNNTSELESRNFGSVELVTKAKTEQEISENFDLFYQLGRSYDAEQKQYYDISDLELSTSEAKTLLSGLNGFIVAKAGFGSKVKLSSIKLGADKELCLTHSKAEKTIDTKVFNSINASLGNIHNRYLLDKLLNISSVSLKSDFLSIEDKSAKIMRLEHELATNQKYYLDVVNSLTRNDARIDIIPFHTTSINNGKIKSSPRSIPQGDDASLTDEEKINKYVYLEAYKQKGYDLENLDNNPPVYNAAFGGDGCVKNLGYPLKIDLSSDKKKEIFYNLCVKALDNYSSIAESSDELKTKQFNQITNLLSNDKTYSAMLNLTSIIDSTENVTRIIPFEFYGVLNKDNELLGHINVPASFVYNEMLQEKLVSLENDRLKVIPTDFNKKKKLINNQLAYFNSFRDYLESNNIISRKELNAILSNIFSKGKITPKEIFQLNYNSSEEMKKIYTISKAYLDSILTLPNLESTNKKIYGSKFFKDLDTSKKQEIVNAIDAIYAQNNKKALSNQFLELERIVEDNKFYKRAEEAIVKYKDGLELIKNTTKIVAHSILFNAHHLMLVNRSAQIENAKKELLSVAKEEFSDNYLDKTIGDIAPEKLPQAVINTLLANKDKTIADVASSMTRQANDEIQKAFDGNRIKLLFLNKLKEHQYFSPEAILSAGVKRADLNFAPRSGKTRTALNVLYALGDKNPSNFYIQNGNATDIVGQLVQTFPEILHTVNLKGISDKIDFIDPKFQKEYTSEIGVLNIPNIIKKFLQSEKDDQRKGEYALKDEFPFVALSFISYFKNKSRSEIKDLINTQLPQRPFLEIYLDLLNTERNNRKINEKDVFNHNMAAVYAYYLDYIARNGYIDIADYNKIRTAIGNAYEKILEDRRKIANKDLRINIVSKNNMQTMLPGEELLMNIGEAAKLQSINYLDKYFLSSGSKDIKFNTSVERIYSFSNEETCEKLAKLYKDAKDTIDFIPNSSLKKLSDNNEIIVFPFDRKSKKGDAHILISNKFNEIRDEFIKACKEITHTTLGEAHKNEISVQDLSRVIENSFNDFEGIKSNIIKSSEFDHDKLGNYMGTINDVMANNKEAVGIIIRVGEFLESQIATTKLAVKKNLDENKAIFDRALPLLNVVNYDELISQLHEGLDGLKNSFALRHNKEILLSAYKDFLFPAINSNSNTIGRRKDYQLLLDKYTNNSSNANTQSLRLNYKQNSDFILMPSKFSKYGLSIVSAKPQGLKFNPEKQELFESVQLNKNIITVDFIKNNNQSWETKISLDTKESIKLRASDQAKILSTKSNTFTLQNGKNASINIIDESHKNQGEDTLSNIGLQNAILNSNISVEISATKKENLQSVFSIREIPDLLSSIIYLATTLPEINDLVTKDAFISATDHDRHAKFDPFLVRANRVLPALCGQLEEFMARRNEAIDTSSYEEILNDKDKLRTDGGILSGINRAFETIISALSKKYIEDDIKKFKEVDSIDLADISFVQEYFPNLADKENILLCSNASILAENFRAKSEADKLKITKSPDTLYDVKIDKDTYIYNNKFAIASLYAKKYFVQNKANKFISTINGLVDALKISLIKVKIEDDEADDIKKEKRLFNKLVGENLKGFQNLIDYYGFDMSIKDFIVMENKDDKETSGLEMIKEAAINGGLPDVVINANKNKEKLLLKYNIAKEVFLPKILPYINNEKKIELHSENGFDTQMGFNLAINKNFIKQNLTNLLIKPDFSIVDGTNNKKINLSLQITFDYDMVKEMLPNVSKYLLDDNDGNVLYKEKVSAGNYDTFYSFYTLVNKGAKDLIEEQLQKGYKFPLFTDKIGSSLLSSLLVLETMIKTNSDNENKSILLFSENQQVISAINKINLEEIRDNHNISFKLITEKNKLQDEINKFHSMDADPDVIISNRKATAEGMQFRSYHPEAYSLYIDGQEVRNNFAAFIQSASRTDSPEARDLFAKHYGKNEKFVQRLNVSFKKYDLVLEKRDGFFKQTDIIDKMQNIFEDGKLDNDAMQQISNLAYSYNKNTVAVIIPKEASRIPYLLKAYSDSYLSSPKMDEDYVKMSLAAVYKLETKSLSENIINNKFGIKQDKNEENKNTIGAKI